MCKKLVVTCSFAMLFLGACGEDSGEKNAEKNQSMTTFPNENTIPGQGDEDRSEASTNNNATNEPETVTTKVVDSPMCAKYCELAMSNCRGDFELYPNEQACLTTCADELKDDGVVDCSEDPGSCSKFGDSVNCRLYFAFVSLAAPQKHCGHAAVNPTDNLCKD